MSNTLLEENQATNSRNIKINIRAQQNQRDLIDRAAQVQGKSRSDFMLESACQKAQEVLLEQVFFTLDAQKYQHFLDCLDAQPSPNDQLVTLLAKPAPWE
ncbi:DUF1778 domain-containing protein [Synechococcus moorigangaii CMS01]|nr:DUF1778 domain-containing protein [Synechococcus moorigangaii CMS01]